MTQSLSELLLTSQPDERRRRILGGALECFLAYGYQRTTMDDIARAADVSRPALYLQFRNKQEIYRELASIFVAHLVTDARAMLEAAGLPLKARLAGALTCILGMMEVVEASPHGAEILDMKTSLAADLVCDGRQQMATLLGEALAMEGVEAERAALHADMLLDALDGLKMRQLPADAHRAMVGTYVGIVLAALGRN